MVVMDRDHSRSPRGSYLAIDDIKRLVIQREIARSQKDFASADSFRNQLSDAGVSVFDKTNSWNSSDGRSGRVPTFNEVEAGHGSVEIILAGMDTPFQAPEYSQESEEGQIKSLVHQREQARAAKDFTRSDQLRDELRGLGVEVNDKDKIWKSSNGLSGIVIGYRSGSNQGPSDVEINTLVQQREKARQSSDWNTADMIRTELKEWGVDIFDKDKTWRCTDGRHGTVPPWTGASGQPPATMVVAYPAQERARGGIHMPISNGVNLDELIMACISNAQNPATSARTIALLQQAAMPVASQHAPVHSRAPQRAPQRHDASEEVKEAQNFVKTCQSQRRPIHDDEIIWLVQVRERCRKNKDFAGADKLRDVYRDIGLEMHEKQKSWAMSDGRQGAIPQWTELPDSATM